MFRKKKPTFIIAFDATTQAMATDKFCTKNGLPGRLIPVPREITAGCGFAWKAAPEDETILIEALTKEGIVGFYTYFRNLIYKHSTLSIYFSEFIFINMSYFRYSNSSMSLQTTY